MKLPKNCKLIDFPNCCDERGSLTFAQEETSIPFPIRRVFWIHQVPSSAKRGAHAHRTCAEIIVAVQGGCKITLYDGAMEATIELNQPTQGLFVPPYVWCSMAEFEPDTVLLVMASEPYSPAGYIHDLQLFKLSTQ